MHLYSKKERELFLLGYTKNVRLDLIYFSIYKNLRCLRFSIRYIKALIELCFSFILDQILTKVLTRIIISNGNVQITEIPIDMLILEEIEVYQK